MSVRRYDTIALGLLKKEEEKEERRTKFYFARCLCKCALYIAMLCTHSIGN